MSNRYLERVFARCQLDPNLLRSYFGQMRVKSYEAGQTLPLQDESGPRFCFVADGISLAMVEVRVASEVQHQPVMAYGNGMWLGARNVISNCIGVVQDTNFHHIAATDVSLVCLDFELLRHLMEIEPKLRDFVMKLCVDESIRYTHMMVNIKYGGPVHRVFSGFALFADSSFSDFDSYADLKSQFFEGEGGVNIMLPQGTLGELFGVSRSVISPILHKLRLKGWIDLEYGQTVLLRPHIWRLFALRMRSSLRIPRDLTLDAALSLLDQCLISSSRPSYGHQQLVSSS